MNILYLCDEYPPGRHGGIGTAVQQLARALVRQGHHVVVAGFYPWGYGESSQFIDEGVVVHRFRRRFDSRLLKREDDFLPTRGLLWSLKGLRVLQWDIERSLARYGVFLNTLLEHHRVDIVEQPDYQDYMRFCVRYVPFPALPVPTVVKLHGSMTYLAHERGRAVHPHVREMEADLLHRADGVAAVSEYTARKTAGYLAYPHAIKVLHNGVEMPALASVHKRELEVVFGGSLRPEKGIGQLLLAWNDVHRAVPRAELRIYGRNPTGSLARVLDPLAINSVRFLGQVERPNLMAAFAQASVAVFPSYAESFGLTAVEAMSAGTAVIYTTRTSGPELIRHGVTGLLVDPDDTVDLARQIIRLLQDLQLRWSLAVAGRQHVAEHFNVDRIAKDHISWYADVRRRRVGRSTPADSEAW